MRIYKKFNIEAAHHLPNVPEGHKCYRLHGHSFEIEIVIEGAVDAEKGWVADFSTISDAFRPLYEQLDHSYLNEIEGLENPTSENLARWIWGRMSALRGLYKIGVRETCTSGCEYFGEGVARAE